MKSNSKERLNELIEYFKIKQSDVAKRTGLPKSGLSMYFSGQRQPRQDKLTIIADAYGVDEAWLMGYDVPMFKTESSIDHEAIGNIIGKLFETDGENLDRLIRIYEQLDAETRNAYILIGEKMLSN
jgi:transcriptional regulator with XRE-family HTH domain